MSKGQRKTRRIALFVEGDTEGGEVRQKTLPAFFHNWLDPQLPKLGKVGIQAVKFKGVSNYLDDLPGKVEAFLDDGKANCVFGLVDLYGLPKRIDLSRCESVAQKVTAARQQIRRLVPERLQPPAVAGYRGGRGGVHRAGRPPGRAGARERAHHPLRLRR